jgi:hypothetical protein
MISRAPKNATCDANCNELSNIEHYNILKQTKICFLRKCLLAHDPGDRNRDPSAPRKRSRFRCACRSRRPDQARLPGASFLRCCCIANIRSASEHTATSSNIGRRRRTNQTRTSQSSHSEYSRDSSASQRIQDDRKIGLRVQANRDINRR